MLVWRVWLVWFGLALLVFFVCFPWSIVVWFAFVWLSLVSFVWTWSVCLVPLGYAFVDIEGRSRVFEQLLRFLRT